MIHGFVTSGLEAAVPLRFHSSQAADRDVHTVIDTGFTGYLMLPDGIIRSLGLKRIGTQQAILGDGSRASLLLYRATVIWNGQERNALVLAGGDDALLGMKMLHRHTLAVDVVEGGAVTIGP